MGEIDNVYLQMQMTKSLAKNGDGNWEFDVEASNENLDLEGQKVLRDALLKHKDYFLKEGVVSKDHKHRDIGEDGKITIDEDFVIGEPKEVYVGDNGNVRVKGVLYKSNPYAQKLVQMLKDGSTRIHASVGGLKPKVRQVVENGKKIGEIASVLWDDLALTICPVNPTLSPAVLVKSLSSVEFVNEVLQKAMEAGCETDAANLTGGGAIVKEDCDKKAKNVMSDGFEMRKAAFVAAIIERQNERPLTFDDIRDCACRYGVSCDEARQILTGILKGEDEIDFSKGDFAMKKTQSWDDVMRVMKKAQDELDEIELDDENQDGGEDENGDDEIDDDDENIDDGENIDDDEIIDTSDEGDGDENDDDDALAKRIDALEKSVAECVKACNAGKTMQKSLATAVRQLGKTANPRQSAVNGAMQKSIGSVGVKHKQFDAKTKGEAMAILQKSLKSGEIGEVDFVVAEQQINKSMNDANYQIADKFIQILKGDAK